MFLIYRGFGLAWAAAGVVAFPVLFLLSGSLSLPLIVVAAMWLYYGRPKTDPDTDDKLPSPTLYFIPIWFYGVLVVPLAVLATGFELLNRRIELLNRRIVTQGDREQVAVQQHQPASTVDHKPATSLTNGTRSNDPSVTSDRPTAVPSAAVESRQVAESNNAGQSAQSNRSGASTSSNVSVPSGTAMARAPTHPSTPAVDAPGISVSDETVLRPGRRVLTEWAGRWYPVEVVAPGTGAAIFVDWLGYPGSGHRRYPTTRNRLRLVLDEKLTDYPSYRPVNSESPGTAVEESGSLSVGQELMCQVSEIWLPVVVTGSEVDGPVGIHWKEFGAEFDEKVERSRLRKPDASQARAMTSSSGSRQPEASPGQPVEETTDLAPGQKLAATWARKWYQVVVVGTDKQSVFVDWVGSNSWKASSARRNELRVVTDEEYATCLKYGQDEPEHPERLPVNHRIHAGQMFLCEASGSSIVVRDVSESHDQVVEVDWLGFDKRWNEEVSLDRLAPTPSDVHQRMRLQQRILRMAESVNSASELRPGMAVVCRLPPSRDHATEMTWKVVSCSGDEVRVCLWDDPSAEFSMNYRFLSRFPDDL